MQRSIFKKKILYATHCIKVCVLIALKCQGGSVHSHLRHLRQLAVPPHLAHVRGARLPGLPPGGNPAPEPVVPPDDLLPLLPGEGAPPAEHPVPAPLLADPAEAAASVVAAQAAVAGSLGLCGWVGGWMGQSKVGKWDEW